MTDARRRRRRRRGRCAAQEGSVRTDTGVELYYEIKGEGSPLVLVAGLADDHASWGPVSEELAMERAVITFDNRGIGNSSTPPGPFTIEQMADDVHQLVGVLGLGSVDALGSSMGGAICQVWACEHPQDIRNLVLSNTWVRREPFLELLFHHWEMLAQEQAGQRLLESGALYAFSPGFLSDNESRIEELIGSQPPPFDGYAAACRACRNHDASAIVSEIEVPTLVIAGQDDILTRPAQSEQLAGLVGGARLVTLPTGHMTFWEQPDAFTELVQAFLDSQ